jgi:hypothetical protein
VAASFSVISLRPFGRSIVVSVDQVSLPNTSDDGIKGADPVDHRPGFAAMMQHIAGNGVRTIIVETANRFCP